MCAIKDRHPGPLSVGCDTTKYSSFWSNTATPSHTLDTMSGVRKLQQSDCQYAAHSNSFLGFFRLDEAAFASRSLKRSELSPGFRPARGLTPDCSRNPTCGNTDRHLSGYGCQFNRSVQHHLV
jgi:hypothetical protein